MPHRRSVSMHAQRAALIGTMLSVVAIVSVRGFDAFTSVQPMGSQRYGHTATLLADGRVLVAGGSAGVSGGPQSSAEIFDPVLRNWHPTGPMVQGRYVHTATLLSDGRVLVAGGIDSSGASVVASEIYDPAADTWTATAPMSYFRALHTATLLSDGRVLVVGGLSDDASGTATETAELYDPTASAWTPAGSMSTVRFGHTMTNLPDGRLLVVGGFSTHYEATAEIYDPATDIWLPASPMGQARYFPSAARMVDGRVLVAGGAAGGPLHYLSSAEIFDAATGTWSTTTSMSAPRYIGTATLLPDGRVLLAGGGRPDNSSTELFDPAIGVWTAGPAMADGRETHRTVLLQSGQVFISGGTGDAGVTAIAGAEIWPDIIDAAPPLVHCASPDAGWHPTDVTLACTALDDGSGLASPADASFVLSTAVSAGTETANGFTGSRSICDGAGNCATAGPIEANKVDKKAPSISIASPTSSVYTVGQVVPSSYACTDDGSGVATCQGPVLSGGNVDTSSVGAKSFIVNAADAVGNPASLSVNYTVSLGGLFSAAGPTVLWLGLKNSDDVGTKFDVLVEVLKNGGVVGSGQLDSVPGGSSGFNNAVARTVSSTLASATTYGPGDTLGVRVSVRIAVGVAGHRSGTARLWYGDGAAASRVDTMVNGVARSFCLTAGFGLGPTVGSGPKGTADVFVDRAVGGNPFTPFGTWSTTF